jgi:phage terminase small subunit
MSPRQPPLTLIGPGSTVPPPPRALGPHGTQLWNRVQREYHILDCGGIELLCLICQSLDRAESLSAAIAEDGQTIRTRTGIRAHPALRDELANRALVARLLSKLGINAEPVKPPGRPASGIGWIPPT